MTLSFLLLLTLHYSLLIDAGNVALSFYQQTPVLS